MTTLYTTAPKDYDFGSTVELDPIAGSLVKRMGLSKERDKVRKVEVGEGSSQAGRYASGLYLTVDQEGFEQEVELGYILKHPEGA